MRRIRILLLLCFALPFLATASAAGVPELRGSSSTVSGVYSLTFNLNIATALPAGTTITCRARIIPNPGRADLPNQQLAPIPVRTVEGVASITGSTANCAAEIPFSWTVPSTQGVAMLSYEIDAVNTSGSTPLVVRSSGQQNVGVAFPGLGGSTRLSFNLIF